MQLFRAAGLGVLLMCQAALGAEALTQPAAASKSWEFRPLELPDQAAVLKAAQHNPHIYGLYTWTGEYREHQESIRKVGWKSFRVGGPFGDDEMKLVLPDDVEIMVTISPDKGLKPDVKALENSPYIEGYAKKLAAFVERYGPGGTFFKENAGLPQRPITHIEITNEPNFQYLIPPDGRPAKEVEADREALYAKLLPAAYAAVKSKSKDVRVVGWAAGGAGAGDIRFIEHVHQKNAEVAGSYDILSTHPYVDPAPPEAWSIRSWGGYSVATSLKSVRGILEKNGRGDVPIWYTEIGWPISQQDGGRFPTKGERVSPLMQAANVCRLYAFAQRLGVERVHIMFATDTDNFNAGFFLKDKSWRPAAHAVQNMIKLMPAPKLIEVISDGADGMFIYRFAARPGDKKTVLMAWNVTGPREATLQVRPGNGRFLDMLGNVPPKVNMKGDHTYAVEIGPYPIYVAEDN